jgi:hypothetical protein
MALSKEERILRISEAAEDASTLSHGLLIGGMPVEEVRHHTWMLIWNRLRDCGVIAPLPLPPEEPKQPWD